MRRFAVFCLMEPGFRKSICIPFYKKRASSIQKTRIIKVASICLKIIVGSVIQISIKMILFSMQNTRSLKVMKKFQK